MYTFGLVLHLPTSVCAHLVQIALLVNLEVFSLIGVVLVVQGISFTGKLRISCAKTDKIAHQLWLRQTHTLTQIHTHTCAFRPYAHTSPVLALLLTNVRRIYACYLF